jgi:predicted lipoprotein with Yx(FWY)xxD motif
MFSESTTQTHSRWAHRPRASRSLAAVAAVAVVALIAAACGSSTPSAKSSTTNTQAPAGTPATTAPASQVVAHTVANTKVGGTILVNASGLTLYKFSADSAGMSACTGACAMAWPLQVTYNGSPLYTFEGDSAAGDTNGQNLTEDGGLWTVVMAAASVTSPVAKTPVTTPPSNTPANTTPTTKAPTTTKPSGGGYGY